MLNNNCVENLIGEVWRDIPGFENLYQVSNLARVKSLAKTIVCKSGMINKYPERLISQRVSQNGYFDCHLSKNNSPRSYLVHRLMGLAWIPNPNNYEIVHHKNHNKLDNSISNLEWTTKKNNSCLAAQNERYKVIITKLKKNHHINLPNQVPKYYLFTYDLPNEIWKDVVGYEDCYLISNYGRLKSKTRLIDGFAGGVNFKRRKIGQIISPVFGRGNYLRFTLRKNGEIKSQPVQRIVALHFICNINKKPCVHHIDNNRLNNNAENLQWVTHKENVNYAIKAGNLDLRGEKGYLTKLNNEKVLSIRTNIEKLSIAKMAVKYNVTRKCISNIINRKTWKHI